MVKKIQLYRRFFLQSTDVVAFAASYYLAYQLRFDFHVPGYEWAGFLRTVTVVALLRGLAFYYFSAYAGLWRYASMSDLSILLKSVGASQVAIIACVLMLEHAHFPRSIFFIDPLLALMLVGLVRFGIRMTREWRSSGSRGDLPRLLIFGAGDLGESVVREIQRRHPREYHLVGFVDDERAKWHHRIHGVPILGGRADLPRLIAKHRVNQIAVAVNHSRGQIIRELMDLCKEHPVQLKTVPTIAETLSGDFSRHKGIRKIELSDLLARKPVETDRAACWPILEGKTVLVTGAGGTIGSELCRQILRFKPAKLLLLEKHNTALFYIDRELTALDSSTTLVPLAGDVGDVSLLENVFTTHRPQVVFHAAAHKHVPLMESNPQEAIKNNTLNTFLLAEKSVDHEVERFLYISTDKAVRPTNVMGASKRLGEMIVRAFGSTATTKFMAVRFGNVLGSSGSAINIFKEQIASGGPVTVTHPDITRYFMTTAEAVQLILQACAMGAGGEIFVLNMGEPIKVVDVARNLILLSGLKPDHDIKIVFTGPRPGEKLFEELFRDGDIRRDTGHRDIFAAVPEPADLEDVRSWILDLAQLCARHETIPLLDAVKGLVPTYQVSAQAAAVK
jgi:FlaA1/EpsC-like NDP-sugar epimerase